MKTSLLLLLLTGLVQLVLPVPHKYYLIQPGQTWSSAQAYCRANHIDLATIETSADMDRVQATAQAQSFTSPAWIGLYLNINAWFWSYQNQPAGAFTVWGTGEPNNIGGNDCCGFVYGSSWYDSDCSQLRAFMCEDDTGLQRYVFYSTTKTWLDAQSYCRQYHTDLASAQNFVENAILSSLSPVPMWFGLFRDGWKWSDQTKVSTIPWMPGRPDNTQRNEYCGVLSNAQVDDDVCSGNRAFFCYSAITAQQQTVRVKLQSDQDVNDPAVMSTILEKIKQKLMEHGLSENTTLQWRARG